MTERVVVAVRVRPLLAHEGCRSLCVTTMNPTQLCVGHKRVFDVDKIFGFDATEQEIYASNVAGLVSSFLEGYNATVLAYGQTGTGKTYTMDGLTPLVLQGILEQTAAENNGSGSSSPALCRVQDLSFSYVEIYGEAIRDLLAPPSQQQRGRSASPAANSQPRSASQQKSQQKEEEKEGPSGSPYIDPVTFELLVEGNHPPDGPNVFGTSCVMPKHHTQEIFTNEAKPNDNNGDELNEYSLPPGATPEEAGRGRKRINSNSKALQLYDASPEVGGGTYVMNCRFAKAESIDDVYRIISYGNSMRATGATNMNDQSSRSHAVFTIYHTKKMAKLHLVDLAGSERNKKTLNTGVRFKESIGINSGLLALGNVIRALATNKGHIPYRSSKLTRLLSDSLGGNSKTLFLTCVAPNKRNLDETVRSMQYSCKAMKILNEPLPVIDQLTALQQKQLDEMQHLSNLSCEDIVNKAQAMGDGFVAEQATEIQKLYTQVKQLQKELHEANANLKKDEVIFEDRVKLVKSLRRENKSLRQGMDALRKEADLSNSICKQLQLEVDDTRRHHQQQQHQQQQEQSQSPAAPPSISSGSRRSTGVQVSLTTATSSAARSASYSNSKRVDPHHQQQQPQQQQQQQQQQAAPTAAATYTTLQRELASTRRELFPADDDAELAAPQQQLQQEEQQDSKSSASRQAQKLTTELLEEKQRTGLLYGGFSDDATSPLMRENTATFRHQLPQHQQQPSPVELHPQPASSSSGGHRLQTENARLAQGLEDHDAVLPFYWENTPEHEQQQQQQQQQQQCATAVRRQQDTHGNPHTQSRNVSANQQQPQQQSQRSNNNKNKERTRHNANTNGMKQQKQPLVDGTLDEISSIENAGQDDGYDDADNVNFDDNHGDATRHQQQESYRNNGFNAHGYAQPVDSHTPQAVNTLAKNTLYYMTVSTQLKETLRRVVGENDDLKRVNRSLHDELHNINSMLSNVSEIF